MESLSGICVVVERTRAAPQARGGPDCFVNESPGACYGIAKHQALGQSSGDGGRISASRSVRVGCVQTWGPKFAVVTAIPEQVDSLLGGPVHVAAFDQCGPRAHFTEYRGSPAHVFDSANGNTGER